MLEAMTLSVKFPREGRPASKLAVRPSDDFAGDEPFRPPLPLPSVPMFFWEKNVKVWNQTAQVSCIGLFVRALMRYFLNLNLHIYRAVLKFIKTIHQPSWITAVAM
jgi:hypothetical protein